MRRIISAARREVKPAAISGFRLLFIEDKRGFGAAVESGERSGG
jgi:hypothetical protein